MRARGGKILRLTLPIKAAAHRFAFVLLLLLAVSLLVIGRADPALTERVRTALADSAAPVLDLLTQPVVVARRAGEAVQNWLFLHNENARLREENERLLHWQEVARRLEQDNGNLRRLMKANFDPPFVFITARVVADSGGPFVRTVLMYAGERDGVSKAQAVVADVGLIGRVAEVGQRASRILLFTDLNSRIPVVAGRFDYRGVLSGDNSERPRLDYLPIGAELEVGDRVVTSGDGGVFPPGLPVGTVASIKDGVARVQPFVDLSRVEFVRVLRYEGVTLPRGEARRPLGAGRR